MYEESVFIIEVMILKESVFIIEVMILKESVIIRRASYVVWLIS